MDKCPTSFLGTQPFGNMKMTTALVSTGSTSSNPNQSNTFTSIQETYVDLLAYVEESEFHIINRLL